MKKLGLFLVLSTFSFSCFAQSNVIECIADPSSPTISFNAKGEDGKWIKDGSWAYKNTYDNGYRSKQSFENNDVMAQALKSCNQLKNEWTIKKDCIDGQNKYTCAYNTKTKTQATTNGSSVGGQYIWSLNVISKIIGEALVEQAYKYQKNQKPGAIAVCEKPKSDSDFFFIKMLQRKDAMWKIRSGQFYAYQNGDYSTMVDLQMYIDNPTNPKSERDKKIKELVQIKALAQKNLGKMIKACNAEVRKWNIGVQTKGSNLDLTPKENYVVYYKGTTNPEEYSNYEDVMTEIMKSLVDKIDAMVEDIIKSGKSYT